MSRGRLARCAPRAYPPGVLASSRYAPDHCPHEQVAALRDRGRGPFLGAGRRRRVSPAAPGNATFACADHVGSRGTPCRQRGGPASPHRRPAVLADGSGLPTRGAVMHDNRFGSPCRCGHAHGVSRIVGLAGGVDTPRPAATGRLRSTSAGSAHFDPPLHRPNLTGHRRAAAFTACAWHRCPRPLPRARAGDSETSMSDERCRIRISQYVACQRL